MKDLTATDAARRFSEILDAVEHGESFRVQRHGRTIARIVPDKRPTGKAAKEALKRLHLGRDWADAVEEARALIVTQERDWAG